MIDSGMIQNNAVIRGGSIDDTPIGATTPSTGSFTSLNAVSHEDQVICHEDEIVFV